MKIFLRLSGQPTKLELTGYLRYCLNQHYQLLDLTGFREFNIMILQTPIAETLSRPAPKTVPHPDIKDGTSLQTHYWKTREAAVARSQNLKDRVQIWNTRIEDST